MPNMLTVSDLKVSFEGTPAIENISFSLDEGDTLAVIGPNGAGKTVFVKSLLNMIDFAGKVAWKEGSRIGYVPQKIDADRHLPITFRNLLDAKAAIVRANANDMSSAKRAVDLGEKVLDTPVGHLSGGQFQRGLIALALLGKPTALILDEPTASIDKPGEEQFYELIHRLQDRYGITTILVSHDLSFVYRYATKVLCLNRSGICFGKPDEALTPEVLKQLYGGSTKFYHHIHHDDR